MKPAWSRQLKKLMVLWWLVAHSLAVFGQHKAFAPGDSRLKVYGGDTVSILADSAYIVSEAQALLLNEKLLALQEVQRTHLDLYHSHAELLDKVGEIEAQVSRLLERMQSARSIMEGNLVLLLQELDQSIAILKQANTDLDTNNTLLREQLSQMDQTVKHLRQENRRMAWRHTRDKVLIAVAGLGVGFVLGSL